MKRFLHIILVLLLTSVLVLSIPSTVIADGEDGEHTLEMEVNGIHVSLANQNEWKKGENTVVVTLKDGSGSPVNDAGVEIMIEPKAETHAAAEDSHDAPDATSAHGAEEGHSNMPGMEVEEPAADPHEMPAHAEETESLPLEELGEHGIYVAEAHLDASGTHEVDVMFHANGEMLEATFVIEIPGVFSKTVVLWSFVAINIVLITSAAIMKKQSIPVKGR